MYDHSDRNAFYRRYDAAVAALPSELQSKADFRVTGEDRQGIHFYDQWGQKFATVSASGNVTLPGATSLTQKAAPKKAAPAGMTRTQQELFIKSFREVWAEIGNLRGRLKAIEQEQISKSLDAQAFDVIEEMSQRIGRLESGLQDIADHGLRFKGFWREGVKAARGDAFSHNGSMWRALQNTNDKPCSESSDWQVVVKKGRDGRDAR